MNKDKLLQMIKVYGDACEAFGDYMSQNNATECQRLFNEIVEYLNELKETEE